MAVQNCPVYVFASLFTYFALLLVHELQDIRDFVLSSACLQQHLVLNPEMKGRPFPSNENTVQRGICYLVIY